MRYLVIETDECYDDYYEAIDSCIEEDYHEDDDYFEEWVNNRYDWLEINGYSYRPYDILDNMDQNNLDDLRTEYCEMENENDRDNAVSELRYAESGDEIEVQRYTIQVLDDESGDFDGDDKLLSIEELKKQLEEKKAIKVEQTIQDEKDEKDLMKMFQIVGE